MITVADLLDVKGFQVWKVSPDATVLDALLLMAKKNVGALVVEEDGKLIGIISERDFARHTANDRCSDLTAPVSKFMTSPVHTVGTAQTIDECMSWMTGEHIRHLPVLEDEKLVGLISIGDVVKALLKEKDIMLTNMEELLTGRGYVTRVR